MLTSEAKGTGPGEHIAVVVEHDDCESVPRISDDGGGIDPGVPSGRVDACVRAPLATGAPPSLASSEGLRILVVDDNADARELLGEALRLLGHVAHAAAGPRAALALAPRVQPQVALLDIGLPEMDGYQLGRRLRGVPGLEHLPLVALTGYGQPRDRQRSQAAGFFAHLVKPVGLDAIGELLRAVAEQLDPARR